MANRTDFFKLLMCLCLYLSQVMKSSLAFELFFTFVMWKLEYGTY